MNVTIKPKRLTELRNQIQITQAELANRSGISDRQLSRIEGTEDEEITVREHTVKKLAEALKVKMGVLTGEMEITQKKKSASNSGSQVQFDLVQHRYGIKKSELVTLAPLLFTLLAEATIAWHWKRQKRLESVRDELNETIMIETFPHDYETTEYHTALGASDSIGFGVRKDSLFGDSGDEWNPFAAYLQHFLEQIKQDDEETIEVRKSAHRSFVEALIGGLGISDPNLEKAAKAFEEHGLIDPVEKNWDDLVSFPEPAFPGDKSNIPFAVLDGLLNYITNRDNDASEALWSGDVRIRDIDKELLAPGKEKERVKFLASRKKPAKIAEELKGLSGGGENA